MTADTVTAIPREFLEQERRTLGERVYRMEYFGQWSDVLASVFSEDAIESAMSAGVRPLWMVGADAPPNGEAQTEVTAA